MAILRTWPFRFPNFVQAPPNSMFVQLPPYPVNILMVTLTNQTNRTLSATVEITRSLLPANSVHPATPMEVLLPVTRFTLTPNTSSGVAQSLVVPSDSTNPQQVLMVEIGGDVKPAGELLQAGVTGGFSSDGVTLDFAEPTMLFRHEDLVDTHRDHHVLHSHDLNDLHNLDDPRFHLLRDGDEKDGEDKS